MYAVREMMMKKEIASQINKLMLDYSAKLSESLRLVKENCSEDEYVKYRETVAKLMGDMLLDVMNPIYAEHPELKPDQLK